MFARGIFTLVPLALLASASHLEARNSCSTGNQQCCQSTQSVDQASSLLPSELISAALNVGGLIGLGCSPLEVIGVGAGCSATQQAVCCENVQQGGLVNLGCTPLNLNA